MNRPFEPEIAPAVRRNGSRGTVVCLHSSASSGGQWRSLVERLSPGWQVLAPDLYGYGKHARQDDMGAFTLDDELKWLAPVFDEAGERFHVVGHSYGGLMALYAALKLGKRVRSITVYEPAAWTASIQKDPGHEGAVEIAFIRDQTVRLVEEGRLEEAAKRFVAYWAGPEAWNVIPAKKKAIVTQAMKKVRSEFLAELNAHTAGHASIESYASIQAPVLYLMGSRTKKASHRVADVLAPVLRGAAQVELTGLGHMGPSTHADLVNELIEQFVSNQHRSSNS